ncbi:MAG: hypothetical protein ACRDVW_05040 [Acidimicrobiales bacterium]
MSEVVRWRATVTLGAAIGIGLAVWAAFTNPFTDSANTVTAIAIGIGAVMVAARWHRPAPTLHPPTSISPGRGAPRWWPWLALGLAIAAWELVSLFTGPRVDHPTVSSLYDSATTQWRALKAPCFFGWLALGAALVRS